MKMLLAGVAAVALAGAPGAYAQSEGPTYSNTIHQSVGGRDSRGFPKYYHGRHHVARRHMSTTTGAGSTSSGPSYDPSIHQSVGGRDSRGNPKYNEEKGQ